MESTVEFIAWSCLLKFIGEEAHLRWGTITDSVSEDVFQPHSQALATKPHCKRQEAGCEGLGTRLVVFKYLSNQVLLEGCGFCLRCFGRTFMYVPCNLGICAILRLHCAFSESWDCIPILRLRTIVVRSRDCATIVRNLQIVQIMHAHYS